MAQVFSRRDPFLPGAAPGVRLAVAVAGALALATLSWFVVERPALALKRRSLRSEP